MSGEAKAKLGKIYFKENVVEMAEKRMSRLFDEFEEVVVEFSGGKDITVILELALREARKRNRLPLSVMFIDQEAEWTETINYMRRTMTREEVRPYWYQMPIYIDNASSSVK